jgi:hypothetical protein
VIGKFAAHDSNLSSLEAWLTGLRPTQRGFCPSRSASGPLSGQSKHRPPGKPRLSIENDPNRTSPGVSQSRFSSWLYADGKPDRLRELAGELVRRKPDIIVAFSTTAARPAKQVARCKERNHYQQADYAGSDQLIDCPATELGQ